MKMVLASAVNSDGDQLYPRTWNPEFVGLPIVWKEEQERQTITETELAEEILANAKGRYYVLFALLAGSGLRIGEALAVKDTSFSPDCRITLSSRSILTISSSCSSTNHCRKLCAR